jgi:integrase
MKAKFDDPTIRNLELAKTDYVCMAKDEPGFGIRVLPSGTMTFFYQYKVDGQRRTMTLGNYVTASKKGGEQSLKTARELYQAELAKVKALRRGSADGVDPVAEKKRKQEKRISEEVARSQAVTVAKLIEEYIEKHAKPSKRSWYEDERILNKDALVVWGKRKAADIKKRDVVLLLESIVDRGSPGSANSNFKIIRKMFRFAVQRDILEHSPCDGVVMPAPLNRGDRVLSESEIKILWNSLDACHASADIRSAIKLILLTGQRPGEVIGMHTNEIDGHWWTVPAERSKNGKSHRVYLTDTALDLVGPLEVLDSLTKEKKPKGFIFPCTNFNKNQAMGRLSISQAVGRNLAVPILINGKPVFDKDGKAVTENKLGVADFTPHDLRRTAATFMSQMGTMDEIIDAVLNHTKQGIIRTYNLNKYDNEKQIAFEAWGRKLNSIVNDTEAAKVIPFTRKVA